jgi:DNA repair exonuclease SbcCD nuclease subunit
MRVAHLSDLHLGRCGRTDDVGAQRLISLRTALGRIQACRPDAILVAGDVFDSPSVDRGVIEAAARALDRCRGADGQPIPVAVIPGNHDPADAEALWSAFGGSLTGDSQVRLVLEPECLSLCDGRLVVEAYPCGSRYSPEAPWASRLALPQGVPGRVHVVLAHGTLLGGPVPEGESEAYPFTLAEAEQLGAEYVALGHFHGVYPAWDGDEYVERSVCYCGTHEPEQFGSDAGWVILADLCPGSKARLSRLRVGRRQWTQLALSGPTDLPALEGLRETVECDADPSRFVVRIKIAPTAKFLAEEAADIDMTVSTLRALGAQVDRVGEYQTLVNVQTLDLSELPRGAVREALSSLREEWETADVDQREVLEAALQLGYVQLRKED